MKIGKSVVLIAGTFVLSPVAHAGADPNSPELAGNYVKKAGNKSDVNLLLPNPYTLIHRWSKMKKPLQSVIRNPSDKETRDFFRDLPGRDKKGKGASFRTKVR